MITLFCGRRHTYMGTDNSVLYGKRPPPGPSSKWLASLVFGLHFHTWSLADLFYIITLVRPAGLWCGTIHIDRTTDIMVCEWNLQWRWLSREIGKNKTVRPTRRHAQKLDWNTRKSYFEGVCHSRWSHTIKIKNNDLEMFKAGRRKKAEKSTQGARAQ